MLVIIENKKYLITKEENNIIYSTEYVCIKTNFFKTDITNKKTFNDIFNR
ncbi:hypothetical protein [Peptoniphilus asaccharolyticus]|nr:hypothetical protein [Peptoniphilus asaccharolyticus]